MAKNTLTKREAGTLRIELALDHIQEAQNELARAQQELSAVVGLNGEFAQLSVLWDRVKARWYRLDAKLQKSRKTAKGPGELDHEPTDKDSIPHGNGCGHPGWVGR